MRSFNADWDAVQRAAQFPGGNLLGQRRGIGECPVGGDLDIGRQHRVERIDPLKVGGGQLHRDSSPAATAAAAARQSQFSRIAHSSCLWLLKRLKPDPLGRTA
jgi:hypothetical protein